mmetsp:Transcript_36469/g.56970  ORF Transcript_36469/g.56970 Transcript_36469/m.56970 type:complete len:280 (-) Transcript_36469:301-1140(-)|eukprot:CAMPEP_0184321450 /NCGR_PEP_ID=MMETSP1049-20130417/119131_1 /TAXON_ID=77928 /ORGANISM="Proteomonas sulcata, Strain CCMP704" /LENGTH=279 /DNA_ID=CAMNT_0026642259 /DNA_START=157 /DNA_END=996 /DNA_ORIENTATION=-
MTFGETAFIGASPQQVQVFSDRDLVDVIVSNVNDWLALVRLRTSSRWLRQLCDYQMTHVGVKTGSHQTDFDSNGVVHLLGTGFGRRKQFSLQEASSRCRITTSAGQQSSAPMEVGVHPFFTPDLKVQWESIHWNNDVVFVLDKTPRRVFTPGRGIGAWFCLDLGPFVSVVPETITLRHSSGQNRALRSFKVEGSNDQEVWKCLLSVLNDPLLQERQHSSATWKMDPATGGSESSSLSYRFLRVTKTGNDSCSDGNLFMHLSGMEVYGCLKVDMSRKSEP